MNNTSTKKTKKKTTNKKTVRRWHEPVIPAFGRLRQEGETSRENNNKRERKGKKTSNFSLSARDLVYKRYFFTGFYTASLS